jgi:hypothetical protein
LKLLVVGVASIPPAHNQAFHFKYFGSGEVGGVMLSESHVFFRGRIDLTSEESQRSKFIQSDDAKKQNIVGTWNGKIVPGGHCQIAERNVHVSHQKIMSR